MKTVEQKPLKAHARPLTERNARRAAKLWRPEPGGLSPEELRQIVLEMIG